MKRIKYVSRHAWPVTREEVEQIEQHAWRANAARDITGVLLSVGDLFFQIIEGPEAAVDDLFAEIDSDDRHFDVVILDEHHDCVARMFPGWPMKAVFVEHAAHLVDPLRIDEELSRLLFAELRSAA